MPPKDLVHAKLEERSPEARTTPWSRVPPCKSILSRFANDESGATAIEYGLIAALISVVIIGAITTVNLNLKTTFNSVSAQLGN